MPDPPDGPASKKTDTEGYRSDTEGYPSGMPDAADTQGYPSDTDGYPSSEGTPDSRAAGDEKFDPAEWWKRYGYSSFEAYLKEFKDRQDAMWGTKPKRPRSELPTPTLGAPAVPPRGSVAGRKDRQLCLKLTESDYGELEAAADSFGVKPTTLARMLVRRGVRAAIAEMERDEGVDEGAD